MHPVYDEMIEAKKNFATDYLEDGEHQANAIPADVDWDALNRERKTLTLMGDKNELISNK
jgi:hypothetical protein